LGRDVVAEIGDGENFAYSTFAPPVVADSSGGINDDTKMPSDPMPSNWLTRTDSLTGRGGKSRASARFSGYRLAWTWIYR
jgi:hypothetical protein